MLKIIFGVTVLSAILWACGEDSKETTDTTSNTTTVITGTLNLELTCGGKTCIGTEGQ